MFDIDWANSPGPFPACSFPDITDNYTGGGIGLSDYGPATTCTVDPHAADIVTDVLCPGGSRSLRFAYPVGFGTQGPDFRLPYQLVANPTNRTADTYCRYYVRWSDNYYWRQSDSKTMIWGGYHGGNQQQDYYLQTRGLAGNATAKVVLYCVNINGSGDDGFVRATNVTISPGVWYRWEWWASYGAHGHVKVRIDGTDLTWAYEAGIGAALTWDPNDHDNSAFLGVNFIKLDGTYNVYDDTAVQDWITNNGTMYKHIGRWAAGTQGWIGAAA